MKKKPLERFEAIAQRLVEGSLSRLLGGRLDPLEISAEIARAIEKQQKSGFAPDRFTIQLNPTDFTYLRTKWPDVAQLLIHYVLQIVRELNLSLRSDPEVELLAQPDIKRQFAHVHATHSASSTETTAMFEPIKAYDPLLALRELDAFLIVDGRNHVPLDKPQLTLGRHVECDVMIEGRSVSRRHAQIRWRFGRFIVYDLGSRGGTRVNDETITEFALRPGDHIQLADISLIYGEGLAQTRALPRTDPNGQFTQPFQPLSDDQ